MSFIAGPLLPVAVDFAVPVQVAFDYLADPRNRPQWQSSLRSVELLDEGEPRVGFRWVDVTAPGLRPVMQITGLDRPRSWSEHGRWRSFEATATLQFTPMPDGCRVAVRARVRSRGLLRPLGPLATAAAGITLGPDLRRAARLLSARGAAH